jgi:hypothetical protein
VRHRKVDGFVILPAAFSDGRLSREAWRAVKACLSTVRSTKQPSGLRVRAVCGSDSRWEAVRSVVEIPIRATWVEVWRTIHRVHGLGVLRFGAEGLRQQVGVAIEPVKRANS